MFSSLTILIFLSIFVNFAFSFYVDGSVKRCSAEQVSYMKGKCGKYVNDLTSLTEKSGKGEQYAKNVTDTCQSITNCYAGVKCTESQEQKIIYDQKCEKLYFENQNITKCIWYFYDAVYQGSASCVKEFNYFSKDMRIRRGAYTSGKSCLMNFAKKNCAASAIEYLNSDYERFLEVMTTPTDEEKCDSLHDELMAKQCEPEVKNATLDIMFAKMDSMQGMPMNNAMMLKKCESMKQCLSDYCYYNATVINKIGELCELVNSTIRGTTFDTCFSKISMDVDVTKYECIHYTPSNSPMGMGLATAKMLEFLEDKSCVKTVMKGECDPKALDNFDKEWEKLQKERKEMSMKLSMDLDKLM
ncbi:unnamed protein product [Caenorhabditis brenneri]